MQFSDKYSFSALLAWNITRGLFQLAFLALFFYVARRVFIAFDRLSAAKASFDVRECQLQYESDRSFLLDCIRDIFEVDSRNVEETRRLVNQNPSDDGVDLFNSLVRMQLSAHVAHGPRKGFFKHFCKLFLQNGKIMMKNKKIILFSLF